MPEVYLYGVFFTNKPTGLISYKQEPETINCNFELSNCGYHRPRINKENFTNYFFWKRELKGFSLNKIICIF